MNNVIQKCVEELNKEAPRIDYIRGMLESILVMNTPNGPVLSVTTAASSTRIPIELSDEEKSALERYEKGPIGKVA